MRQLPDCGGLAPKQSAERHWCRSQGTCGTISRPAGAGTANAGCGGGAVLLLPRRIPSVIGFVPRLRPLHMQLENHHVQARIRHVVQNEQSFCSGAQPYHPSAARHLHLVQVSCKAECDRPDLVGRRAINQAMGRVIRHRGDYGAIILADQRFQLDGTRNQISCWLRDLVKSHNNFGEASRSLQEFFQVPETHASLQLSQALTAYVP